MLWITTYGSPVGSRLFAALAAVSVSQSKTEQEAIGNYYPPDTYYTCQAPARKPPVRDVLRQMARESASGYRLNGSFVYRCAGRISGRS